MLTKKQLAKNIATVKSEIEHYRVTGTLATAMLNLTEAGYEFGGHGYGFGSEDFSMTKEVLDTVGDYIDVTFTRSGKPNSVITVCMDWEEMAEFKFNSYGDAVRFVLENFG